MNDRTPTPPEGFAIWATSATVERYHTEDKAWKERHADKHGELERRITVVEEADKAIRESLNSLKNGIRLTIVLLVPIAGAVIMQLIMRR